MRRSEEEFNIGQEGIDTQYERDYINYRPKIEYDPQRRIDGSGLPTDTAGQNALIEGDLDEFDDSSVIQVWEDLVSTIERLDKAEASLSERLQDVSVPLPSHEKAAVQEAASKLGMEGIVDSIPFDLYKETFRHPTLPAATVIQDAFEDYMSDVEGTLNAELYADVAEMQRDWVDMRDFMNRGLFGQLVSQSEIPREVSLEDAALEEIRVREQEMKATYAELNKMKSVNRQIYLAMSNASYGSDDYFQAVKEYDDSKRELLHHEKKVFTKAEVVDLVSQKASDTNENLHLIEQAIDFDPFEEGRYEMLYHLLKQYDSKDTAQKGLKKIQAVLKLAVDGKKTDTDSMKSHLRGVAGQPIKQAINDNLVNGIHLRNEVFRDVFDMIHNLDGVPDDENFAVMLTHIADGANQAENLYKEQASDFYKIHAMDAALRNEKLGMLIDKDAARSTYQMLGHMVDYTTNVDQSWPSQEKMSSWLNDFMEHSKIK